MTELSDDFDENYDRFIVEAVENGLVWGLEGEDGFAVCPSERHEDTDVMPFWSNRELAEAVCVDEWAVYKPVPIDLEEFLDDWLPGLHQDVVLVGVNWTAELEGAEEEPLDLLEDMDEELSD